MMHTDEFNFDNKPFKPKNPNGFYRNANVDTAAADILDGIRKGRGYILLTGEAGLGKTLLLRRCMAEAAEIRFILLGNAHLDFPDILSYLCRDLGLEVDDLDFEQQRRLLLAQLAADASRGQAVALLIDDAHHLRPSTLRRLWDFVEASAVTPERCLSVVLTGLPDIEDILRQPELRPLQERIWVRCRITPLSEMETGLFIDQQLKAAGHTGGDLRSPAVVERIARYGQGVPGAIAQLCDTVLLFARLDSERDITPARVDEAARICFLGDHLGDQAKWPGPDDLGSPIAPPPVAGGSRYRGLPGTLINGLTLATIIGVAVIWLWPSEPVPEDKPPPQYRLGQREPLVGPLGADPSVPAQSSVPAPTPLAVPVPDSMASEAAAPQSRPVLSIETADAPRTPDSVSTTELQTISETNLKVAGSRVDKTRARPSSVSPSRSRSAGPQVSRVQSSSRVAKSRKRVKARRGWRRTVRSPWKRSIATGFNNKW